MTITDDALGGLLDSAPAASRRHLPGRRAWLIAAAVIGVALIALAFAVGGGGNNGFSASSSAPKSLYGGAHSGAVNGAPALPSPESLPAAGTAGGSAGSSGAVTGAPGVTNGDVASVPSVVPGGVPDKVVKTGEMDIEVSKGQVPHTLDRLTGLATLQRGFVAESHSSDGDVPSGSVTLRIPVQAFDATVTAIRHFDGKVVSQQTAGEDVTSKYVDLQARLHSLMATRSSFERLLARATTIGETLEVQSRITDVQTQIEQLQGQLRVLNDQTTYGTLTVTVAEKGKAPVVAKVHHRSGMSAAFHRSLDRFVNGIEAIVGIIGPLLLAVLLGGLAWLVSRFAYRRVVTSREASARQAGAS